jgi:hypothetical protein
MMGATKDDADEDGDEGRWTGRRRMEGGMLYKWVDQEKIKRKIRTCKCSAS